MALVVPNHGTIAIMLVHVFGVTLRIGTDELHLESDTRGEPLTDTDSPVRRYGAHKLIVTRIVTAEGVGTSGGIDEPVLAEGIGHDPVRIQKGVPLRQDPGLRLGSDSVAIDLTVVFVHLFNLTPSRR